MGEILPNLLFRSARARPEHPALVLKGAEKTYAALAQEVRAFACGLADLGLEAEDRVGIFLEKQFEAVTALLGVSAAGGVFVPINPALRPAQVVHILKDCNVRMLVTSRRRAAALADSFAACPDLSRLILLEDDPNNGAVAFPIVENWEDLLDRGVKTSRRPPAITDENIAGLLYTSGSTGSPKGVVLTHRNFVVANTTIADYLKYRESDRILNLPPYSFGFGLSQLFTSLHKGATAVLHTYLSPQDMMRTIVADRVTGVSGVPTAMAQLAAMPWPPEAEASIRYISVAGGRMPENATRQLRRDHPQTDIYLMYGMTETLRSTYLAPEEADTRPTSIGKPIPNANISVLRADETPCDPGEVGELVQKGPLIARGYWNDAARTANVFRPIPGDGPEPAVWSGDMVKRDADGFIYFMGRRDEIMKIRGYRVSPVEIEDVVLASGQAGLAAALCVPQGETDQSLVVYVTPKDNQTPDTGAILDHCRAQLPPYLVPSQILVRSALPLTANGKLERKKLLAEHLEAQAAAPAPIPAQQAMPAQAGYIRRWKDEALHLLGFQKRRFETAADIFAWNFPGRRIAANDTFLTLEGDSLSYVSVSTGLEKFLGYLPETWEAIPINRLEKMRTTAPATSLLRPDIAVRAVALICIVMVHAGNSTITGSSMLLLVLSGVSFARFNWSSDARRTIVTMTRLAVKIIIPTWIMLAVVFTYRHEISWSVLFFSDNLANPMRVYWWLPEWFVQVLLQIFVFMGLLSLVPGIARFGHTRRFTFGTILFAASVALYAGFAYLASPRLLDFDSLPIYFLWLFALGWLIAAAETPGQKLGTYVMMLAALAALITVGRTGDFSMREHGRYWLILGAPVLLWAPSVAVPEFIGAIAGLLARATLFIYLFHWPLADFYKIAFHMDTAFGSHNSPLRFVAGFLTSIALWVAWEATWRTFRPLFGEAEKREDAALALDSQ
jgi:acyl-CoA ligase (AMP-forming) (exosortase A-associated)